MSAATEFNRAMRALGIAAAFTLLGPVILATIALVVVLTLGAPFLELILMTADIEALRPWLTIAGVLLVILTLVATLTPALVTGVAFAVVAVYFRQNAWWVAVAIAAAVAVVVVAIGFFGPPPAESSAVIVPPPVQGARQAAILAAILAVPGALAAFICWFVTRSLHRVPA